MRLLVFTARHLITQLWCIIIQLELEYKGFKESTWKETEGKIGLLFHLQ